MPGASESANLIVGGPGYGYVGPTEIDVYWDTLYKPYPGYPVEPPASTTAFKKIFGDTFGFIEYADWEGLRAWLTKHRRSLGKKTLCEVRGDSMLLAWIKFLYMDGLEHLPVPRGKLLNHMANRRKAIALLVEVQQPNVSLRRLEQRVQALKERAWRAKARTTQLKEAVIGGGVGAQATLVHENKMGSSFRLIRLVYALDGTQVFARSEDTSPNLYKTKSFDILTGPISPGSHSISALAVYRGHGYGVFKYLNKYTFTVRASHTFTAAEGKATRIEASGFEKGGRTTPLEKRPAIDFKVTAGTGEK